jgi:hypothetical protein
MNKYLLASLANASLANVSLAIASLANSSLVNFLKKDNLINSQISNTNSLSIS